MSLSDNKCVFRLVNDHYFSMKADSNTCANSSVVNEFLVADVQYSVDVAKAKFVDLVFFRHRKFIMSYGDSSFVFMTRNSNVSVVNYYSVDILYVCMFYVARYLHSLYHVDHRKLVKVAVMNGAKCLLECIVYKVKNDCLCGENRCLGDDYYYLDSYIIAGASE